MKVCSNLLRHLNCKYVKVTKIKQKKNRSEKFNGRNLKMYILCKLRVSQKSSNLHVLTSKLEFCRRRTISLLTTKVSVNRKSTRRILLAILTRLATPTLKIGNSIPVVSRIGLRWTLRSGTTARDTCAFFLLNRLPSFRMFIAKPPAPVPDYKLSVSHLH